MRTGKKDDTEFVFINSIIIVNICLRLLGKINININCKLASNKQNMQFKESSQNNIQMSSIYGPF